MQVKTVSAAMCLCGCGKITPIAPETRPKRGWKRGQPMPYYPHHSKNRWPVTDGISKRCRKCLTDKPVNQFWINRTNRDGLQHLCRECSKTAVYSYRTTLDGMVSVVRTRHKHALSRYRLTENDYNAMPMAQDGLCAICERPERVLDQKGGLRRLAIDHCHATGTVRALLCAHCNHAIGKLGDDPRLLRRAADYLETHAGSAPVDVE